MAALTPEDIILATPVIVPLKTESIEHFLGRITHLNLQNRGLKTLAGIDVCPNLRAVFAFKNHLAELPPSLIKTRKLGLLMLDDNRIAALTNCEALSELTFLSLNGNALAALGGLEACTSLRELHIAHQFPTIEAAGPLSDPATGAILAFQRSAALSPLPLRFEPATLAALSHSLKILDVSGNRLTSLRPLEGLHALETLLATHNNITDPEEIACILPGLPELVELDVRSNPCTAPLPRAYKRGPGGALSLIEDAKEEEGGRLVEGGNDDDAPAAESKSGSRSPSPSRTAASPFPFGHLASRSSKVRSKASDQLRTVSTWRSHTGELTTSGMGASYRDLLVTVSCDTLAILDGKPVRRCHRHFMQMWQHRREAAAKAMRRALMGDGTGELSASLLGGMGAGDAAFALGPVPHPDGRPPSSSAAARSAHETARTSGAASSSLAPASVVALQSSLASVSPRASRGGVAAGAGSATLGGGRSELRSQGSAGGGGGLDGAPPSRRGLRSGGGDKWGLDGEGGGPSFTLVEGGGSRGGRGSRGAAPRSAPAAELAVPASAEASFHSGGEEGELAGEASRSEDVEPVSAGGAVEAEAAVPAEASTADAGGDAAVDAEAELPASSASERSPPPSTADAFPSHVPTRGNLLTSTAGALHTSHEARVPAPPAHPHAADAARAAHQLPPRPAATLPGGGSHVFSSSTVSFLGSTTSSELPPPLIERGSGGGMVNVKVALGMRPSKIKKAGSSKHPRAGLDAYLARRGQGIMVGPGSVAPFGGALISGYIDYSSSAPPKPRSRLGATGPGDEDPDALVEVVDPPKPPAWETLSQSGRYAERAAFQGRAPHYAHGSPLPLNVVKCHQQADKLLSRVGLLDPGTALPPALASASPADAPVMYGEPGITERLTGQDVPALRPTRTPDDFRQGSRFANCTYASWDDKVAAGKAAAKEFVIAAIDRLGGGDPATLASHGGMYSALAKAAVDFGLTTSEAVNRHEIAAGASARPAHTSAPPGVLSYDFAASGHAAPSPMQHMNVYSARGGDGGASRPRSNASGRAGGASAAAPPAAAPPASSEYEPEPARGFSAYGSRDDKRPTRYRTESNMLGEGEASVGGEALDLEDALLGREASLSVSAPPPIEEAAAEQPPAPAATGKRGRAASAGAGRSRSRSRSASGGGSRPSSRVKRAPSRGSTNVVPLPTRHELIAAASSPPPTLAKAPVSPSGTVAGRRDRQRATDTAGALPPGSAVFEGRGRSISPPPGAKAAAAALARMEAGLDSAAATKRPSPTRRTVVGAFAASGHVSNEIRRVLTDVPIPDLAPAASAVLPPPGVKTLAAHRAQAAVKRGF